MDKLELIPGKPVIIKTQVGEEYSVVTSSGDASDLLNNVIVKRCLLYTSPSPRDGLLSRMPSSA